MEKQAKLYVKLSKEVYHLRILVKRCKKHNIDCQDQINELTLADSVLKSIDSKLGSWSRPGGNYQNKWLNK